MRMRDEMYEEVISRGWNAELGMFVQSYDSETLDASALMMPLVFFVSPSDPKMLQTIDGINRPPEDGGLVSDNLVYRYTICSPALTAFPLRRERSTSVRSGLSRRSHEPAAPTRPAWTQQG